MIEEMLRLGLTGGVASGKSAVAAMLRELGFSVLDADSLAHKLMEYMPSESRQSPQTNVVSGIVGSLLGDSD